MATFDKLADLPLQVDGYTLEGLSAQVSSAFERLTTVVHLHGGGVEGVGEDVVYDGEDQVALQEAGPTLALAGSYTLGEFLAAIAGHIYHHQRRTELQEPFCEFNSAHFWHDDIGHQHSDRFLVILRNAKRLGAA